MQRMDYYIGQQAEFSKTISEYDLYGFAGISGDFNPLHINADYNTEGRFTGQICHGLLVASYISGVLGTRLPGPGTIYLSQTLSFRKPVYLGDTVTAIVKVIKINEKKRILTLETRVINQKKECVVDGEAVVMALADRAEHSKEDK